MSGYRIELDGMVIHCDSARDVAALSREMKRVEQPADEPKKRGPGRPPSNGTTKAAAAEAVRTALCIDLLTAIRDAGSDGADAQMLLRAVGREGKPQAIGGPFATCVSRLQKAGFKPTSVYRKMRGKDGQRWARKPKIDSAIDALRKGVKK